MYKCKKCDEVFETPSIKRTRNTVEYWGSISYEDYEEEICPCCGTDDFEEVCECIICGDYHFDDELACNNVCNECAEEYSGNFDIVYKAFDNPDDKVEIKVHPMIASMLSVDDIEGVVFEHLEWLCKNGHRNVKDFAEEDFICFAERLAELEEVRK